MIGMIYRFVSGCVALSALLIMTFDFIVTYGCGSCMAQIWEPVQAIHLGEMIALLVSIPGVMWLIIRGMEK